MHALSFDPSWGCSCAVRGGGNQQEGRSGATLELGTLLSNHLCTCMPNLITSAWHKDYANISRTKHHMNQSHYLGSYFAATANDDGNLCVQSTQKDSFVALARMVVLPDRTTDKKLPDHPVSII